MDQTEEYLEKALKHFDLAGVARVKPESDAILILGLASTPERDLDETYYEGENFRFEGWIKHVKPRMEILLDWIRDRGFEAEALGWWGYPMSLGLKPGQEITHLKSLAVMAGLGRQGKNTLIINPDFGPWWRLAALRTNAPLSTTGPGIYEIHENPVCSACQACIDACPVDNLLQPYRLLDRDVCRASAHNNTVEGRVEWCDLCLAACPVGKQTTR